MALTLGLIGNGIREVKLEATTVCSDVVPSGVKADAATEKPIASSIDSGFGGKISSGARGGRACLAAPPRAGGVASQPSVRRAARRRRGARRLACIPEPRRPPHLAPKIEPCKEQLSQRRPHRCVVPTAAGGEREKSGAMGMGRGMGMGGGKKFPYPKWVWSPAGGWWCQPVNANRNTAIMAGVWAVILGVTFKFSAANERRYLPPVVYPIPSQWWCKHAVEDDPRLAVSGTSCSLSISARGLAVAFAAPCCRFFLFPARSSSSTHTSPPIPSPGHGLEVDARGVCVFIIDALRQGH